MRRVDRLLAGYFAAVTFIITIRGNIFERDILFVLLAHILFFVLLWLFTKLEPANNVGAFFHDFYPIMLLLAFYGAIGIITMRLDAADIHARDAVVQRWEQAIFGSQVSYEWIRRAPSLFWSGLLHLGYLSYFPVLVFGPLVLWLRGNRDGARRTVLHTMIAFVPCYLAFVLFPVAGPNWIFPEPTGAVRDVWSARIVYDALEASSFGTAFPSSHVRGDRRRGLGDLARVARVGTHLDGPGRLASDRDRVLPDALWGGCIGGIRGARRSRLGPTRAGGAVLRRQSSIVDRRARISARGSRLRPLPQP